MLTAGDLAPVLTLPDADMVQVDLGALFARGRVVIFFYPRDDTPGCTMEALEFTDLQSEFDQLQTTLVGISRDSCDSHGEFRDRHGLTVQLLADLDGEASESYGVWCEKEVRGQKHMVIVRSTFIVDQQGVVRHALYDVKPKGHAAMVLDLVRAM